MDPEYSRCVQRVFVDLYKKGLIYRGKRMVNWCPASLTALSDEEVVMKDQKGFLYYFKVEVVGSARVSRADSGVAPESLLDISKSKEGVSGATPDAATGTVALPGDFAARKANTLAVIDFVLSHTVRMFHPFLPFITEELWHGMGYATDMPENQGGKTIMFAPWPMPLDDDFKGHYGLDDCYLKIAGAKYELVSQGRNLRREANISAAKKIRYVLKPVNYLPPHDIEVIRLLLNAETVEVNENYQPAKGTLTARTELGELFLPLEGLRSAEELAAEKARVTKELEKIEAEISKVEQKLANPSFTQKVPPQVLQEHQQRLAEWQAKREQVRAALAAL
jgi:valyl-tRNA synthetase